MAFKLAWSNFHDVKGKLLRHLASSCRKIGFPWTNLASGELPKTAMPFMRRTLAD